MSLWFCMGVLVVVGAAALVALSRLNAYLERLETESLDEEHLG